MSNALFQYSIRNNVIIEQKILEKGHTQMECDAMHSLIERKMKNRFIHMPSDYINITRKARCNPFPIDTYFVTHGFFQNFSLASTWSYNSIRPGRKTNEPTMTDLRYLHHSPTQKQILFKINFDHELEPLLCRNAKYPNFNEYPALHNERLKIKYQKFKHLQE
ncbi:unnamed protein product [Psylliodes chrysocephalus]|uniref:Uncharacterized protein n=1 Tax=Psylliodes chrysocephalus TaxID=3402493 RepID=A0A9P0GFQ9_9CUCU|nr:unnamed protein product [Psylliodes chrysocephala]